MNRRQSNKRAKLNTSVVCLGPETTVQAFSNSKASVLTIQNNSSINQVLNCPSLSILQLSQTQVVEINDCSILYSLTISDNIGLKMLNLFSVRKLNISRAMNLESIDMENVQTAKLKDLPLLTDITLPTLTEVSVDNVGAMCPHLSSSFPKAHSIELINVSSFDKKERFSGSLLRHLTFRNCNIRNINCLNELDELIVEDCKFLQSITNLKLKSLMAANCNGLIKIESITSELITVSRCNHLRKLSQLDCEKLNIEFCFEIATLPTLETKDLAISRCPSLVKINLSESVQTAMIDNCESLTYIDFDSEIAYGYNNLEIRMYGDNELTAIKDWFVAKLDVRNNSSLESIQNIYNLVDLTVVNCRELCSISDASVLGDLHIEMCPSLEEVSNMYGFTNLVVIECDMLSLFQTYLTELRNVYISNCNNLTFAIMGSQLESLALIDCGAIMVHDLPIDAEVDVKNASLLPNLSSSDVIEDVSQSAALKFRTHIELMITKARLISRYVKKFIVRNRYLKYIRFKNENDVYDCPICHDVIIPNNSTVTSCSHIFHVTCLFEWLKIKRSCPLCNKDQ